MHIILTGATGLVGCGVLDAMLKAKDISRISILSRRPVQMAEDRKDPRVNVIIHKDFEKYDAELLKKLEGARGCVWALGVSQNDVSKEEYVKITRDYAVEAAKAFSGLPSEAEPFRFVFVSGEGATQTPGRLTALYGRVKGETEKVLGDMSAEIPSLRADSARPAIVDHTRHDAIKPYVPDPGLMLRVGRATLGPPIRAFYSSFHTPTDILGQFLTEMAMGKLDSKIQGRGAFRLGQSWVVENVGIRRMMGI